MNKLTYFLLFLITRSIHEQVGINNQTSEATLEILGKSNDLNHYDGFISPQITGNQIAAKIFFNEKWCCGFYYILGYGF